MRSSLRARIVSFAPKLQLLVHREGPPHDDRDRDDDAELLSYRSFASVVGIVAIVVSVVVLVTGAAAVTFLAVEGRAVPAIAAAVLSGGFAVVIAMLVPPTNVTLYEDALPTVQISQESNVSFPSVTFVVATPDRRVLARFHKSVWSRLARNQGRLLR